MVECVLEKSFLLKESVKPSTFLNNLSENRDRTFITKEDRDCTKEAPGCSFRLTDLQTKNPKLEGNSGTANFEIRKKMNDTVELVSINEQAPSIFTTLIVLKFSTGILSQTRIVSTPLEYGYVISHMGFCRNVDE